MLKAYEHMQERKELMRKARNAAFYRDNCMSGKTQQTFRANVIEYVAKARMENKYMIRVFKNWH